jgi:hypothetical protein
MRSTSVTSASARRNPFAAASPPNPPPTITTRRRPADASATTSGLALDPRPDPLEHPYEEKDHRPEHVHERIVGGDDLKTLALKKAESSIAAIPQITFRTPASIDITPAKTTPSYGRSFSTFSCDIAYSRSPAASRAYRFTSLIFVLSVFGSPPSGV